MLSRTIMLGTGNNFQLQTCNMLSENISSQEKFFKESNLYNLSIRLLPNGFSFFVYDDQKRLISLKNIKAPLFVMNKEELIPLLLKEPEMQLPYYNVKLTYESNRYSVVPQMIFKKVEAESLFYFHHKKEKNEIVLSNPIASFETVNIFSVPSIIYEVFEQFFPKLNIEHHITQFLINLQAYTNKEENLNVYLREHLMDVVAIENNQLMLINSFVFQTPEDFVYYLLRVIEELSFDIDGCRIRLFNYEKRHSKLYNLAQKYMKHCEIIEKKSE